MCDVETSDCFVAEASVLELVATGRSALRQGDPAAARAAYSRALEVEESGTVLAGLAEAAYLEHDHDAAIDAFERAYAAFRDSDDPTGAARIAGTLGYLHGMIRGDRAVMGGWISRAQTVLEGTEETAEAGWVEHFKGMFAGPAAERERALPRRGRARPPLRRPRPRARRPRLPRRHARARRPGRRGHGPPR